MHWYIIGKKAFYRTRCALKIVFAALLLAAFSVSVVSARYEKEAYLSASGDPSLEKTVIIDPGHGGEDCGAVGANGIFEKDLNMQISEKLADELRSEGYTVILTRTEDKLLYSEAENIKGLRKIYDLKNRCKTANEYPRAIFVSIHMNSYSESKYHGLQVYHTPSDGESTALANKIQSSVHRELQPENKRVIKSGKGIYVLENTEPVSVLIECGFLTNTEECKRLSEEEYQSNLCRAIARGIIEYKEGKSA